MKMNDTTSSGTPRKKQISRNINFKPSCPLLLVLMLVGVTFAEGTTMLSPDGKVKVSLTLDKDYPQLSLSFNGTEVLAACELKGFLLKGAPPLGQEMRMVKSSKREKREWWTPVSGKRSKIHDHCMLYEIELQEKRPPHRKLNLAFRLYDDGFAYQYEIPKQKGLSDLVITDELNTYNFTGDFKTFVLRMKHYSMAYEDMYSQLKISELKDKDIIAMPLLIEAEKCWLAITEAGLIDYPGMYLSGVDSGEKLQLVSELAPLPGTKRVVKAKASGHLRTPWRTFMLGEKPGDLIESNLILNLNPKSKIKDTSWIKPGKLMWPWWSGRIAVGINVTQEEAKSKVKSSNKEIRKMPPTTAVMKHYVDFAARNNIAFVLIDAGWYSKEIDAWKSPKTQDITKMEPIRSKNYSVREVIDYAKTKGVGIHLWVHILSLAENMDALKLYSEWGVKGIKIDSYGGDHQEMVKLVHDIAEKCAENKLLLNYHGAYKPTGISRTWPNFLTREAVYALEQSKAKPFPNCEHNVMLPFTRMLAGPMDYTPGAFDLDGIPVITKMVQGTRAAQLAMYVVYFSPLQMLADYSEVYENSAEDFQFIKDVPVTWDETKVVDGYPGDFIIMARKKASSWFLGAMSDEKPRSMTIKLDFLDGRKTYKASIYKDGPTSSVDREDVAVEHKTLTAKDSLKIKLAPGGGLAVSFVPID
jgi:alpha-glucosidase